MDYSNINDYETLYMIKEHDDYYLNLMFKKYYPLILKTASKYIELNKYIDCELSELIEEGNIILSKAIDTYNENYNVKFITYFTNLLERRYISYFRSLKNRKSRFGRATLEEVDYDIKYSTDEVEEALTILQLNNVYLNIKSNLSFTNSCIFELTYNGFKAEEISKLLDISINNIRSRQYRIRKKAKEMAL